MSSKFEKLADAAVRCAPANCRADREVLSVWLQSKQDAVLERLFIGEDRRISRRTKILAYCIAAQRTPREANKLLRIYGAEALYVRNLPDITIMRALALHYSAAELCEIMAKIAPLARQLPTDEYFTRRGRFFCTAEGMEAYLDAACCPAPEEPGSKKTCALTSELQAAFDELLEEDNETFLAMVKDYLPMFSTIRERTRREFIRYLCRYARSVIRRGNADEMDSLFMNMDTEPCAGKRPVNFPELSFHVNDKMYLGYLFSARDATSNVEDDEEVMKENRKCAKLLQGFLLGKNDISRTLFTAFLLYFLRGSTEGTLDMQQVNDVLDKCGWRQIDVGGDDPFDRLVLDMLDNQELSENDYLKILFQDLEDPEEPVFEKYEGEDAYLTRSTATVKALQER